MGGYALDRVIVFDEPALSGGSTRVEITVEDVLRIMRIRWKSEPYKGHPFDEEIAIDDYMAVNWAWFKDEEEV